MTIVHMDTSHSDWFLNVA